MKINKKGFTLVELLAVIAIIGGLITFASMSVLNLIETSKTETLKKAREAVLDGALTYALREVNLDVCSNGFAPNNVNAVDPNGKRCIAKISVKDLKQKAYVTDNSNTCSEDAIVVIYNSYLKMQDGMPLGEFKVWAADDICKG